MSGQILDDDRQWLWLSIGAAACVVCGVFFRGGMTNRRDNRRRRPRKVRFEKSPVPRASSSGDIKHRKVEDSEEKPCVEVGATLLEQLRLEEWHIRTSDALDGLNFSSMSKPHLIRMAGELWFVLRKNIISLETACEKYETKNNVLHMLKEILVIHTNSLEALKKFGKALNLDLQKQVISAAAQGYPHCMCFLADHGTCVEIVAALAVSFPSWQRVSGRLRDELKESQPEWTSDHFELLDELARTIDDFDGIAVKAIDEGLALQDTSRGRIESSTKVLEESQKLFWEHIVSTNIGDDIGEWPNLEMSVSHLNLLLPSQREVHCLDAVDGLPLSDQQPGAGMVHITDILPARPEMKEARSYPVPIKEVTGFEHPARNSRGKWKINAAPRHDSVGDLGAHLKVLRETRRPRSNTVGAVPILNRFEKRFEKMSQEEQENELSDMNCLMESLASNLNKLQDMHDEQSSSGEKSASAESPGAGIVPNEDDDSEEQMEIIAISRQISQLEELEKESKNQTLEITRPSLFDLGTKNLLSETI